MGFSSIDDMVSEMTAGKTWHQDWSKISASTAAWVTGTWNDTAQLTGSPVAGAYPGTAAIAQTPTDKNGGAVLGGSFGIYHGGNVASSTKHLTNAAFYATAATAVPGIAMLVDVAMYYPGIAMNSTLQVTFQNSEAVAAAGWTNSGGHLLLTTATNDFGSATHYTSVEVSTTTTLPTGIAASTIYYMVRTGSKTFKFATSEANAIAGTYVSYTDGGTGTHTVTVTPNRYADGAGLRAYLVSTATATTSVGTAVIDLANSTYTNQAGAGSKQIGAAITCAAFGTNIPLQTRIEHSTTAANGYGPFLPLAAGDYGVRRFAGIKLSTAYTGANVSALVLAKPLATVPIVTSGAMGERNFLMQVPALPRIYDGACLCVLFYNGNALALSTPIMGSIDVAWG